MPPTGRRRRRRGETELETTTAAAWLKQRRALASELCLLPYLQFGPNNQFLQLMEAAVVAKALGRVLLLPEFHSWVGDETSSRGTIVAFHETFDRESVRAPATVANSPNPAPLDRHRPLLPRGTCTPQLQH